MPHTEFKGMAAVVHGTSRMCEWHEFSIFSPCRSIINQNDYFVSSAHKKHDTAYKESWATFDSVKMWTHLKNLVHASLEAQGLDYINWSY